MIGYIYKLTAPNGKIYIGQTIDLKSRFGQHKRSYNIKTKTKIISAIVSFGWDSFLKEVLFEGETTLDKLNELEISYISQYDSVNNGLNLEAGGLNGKHAESTKIKMRESALRINSDKDYTKWRNRGWVGRKHTEETRLKMSLNSKDKGMDADFLNSIRESGLVKVRKIVLNIDNGIFYDSIKDASDSISMNYRTFKNKVNGSKKNNTSFIIV